jgi:hypothetical protein
MDKQQFENVMNDQRDSLIKLFPDQEARLKKIFVNMITKAHTLKGTLTSQSREELKKKKHKWWPKSYMSLVWWAIPIRWCWSIMDRVGNAFIDYLELPYDRY